jgi:outer membrane receptor protein involved in Fe transport
LAAIVFVALPLAAQQSNVSQNNAPQTGSVSGTIVEKTAPVRYANVLIFTAPNGKFAKGALTDSLGTFTIPNLTWGTYSLRVRRIGFKERRMDITLSAATPSLNLRTIILQNDETVLEGVEVTADKDVIKKTAQGVIMNADATLSQQGGTAIDVLRNMPTVAVDADGGVTIRGKSPLILINGRNSGVTNLESIPAESIESIEIINNPGAQYDADSEGGIINIKLKKSDLDNLNVALALGGGYGASGRLNGSALINYKTDKWNIGLGIDSRYAGRTRAVIGDRIDSALPSAFYLTQRRSDMRIDQAHNLRFTTDFTPDEQNLFSVEFLGALSGQDNDETLISTIESQTKTFQSKYSRRSLEIARDWVGEVSVGYTHNFATKGQKLSFNISTSLNFGRENTDITNQTLNASSDALGTPFYQRTHNYVNFAITTFKADYAHPLTENSTIEIGYKGIIRSIETDFQSLNNVNGNYVVIPYQSNNFTFLEQVHSAYGQYNLSIGESSKPHWKINLGLRGEYAQNGGNTPDQSVSFTNVYWNLFPSATAVFYPASGEFWKFNYGRRINRPTQLNPFTDITDSLNQASGNPRLQPEYIESFELGYSREWDALSLSASAFYRYATNTIRGFTRLRSDGVAISRPENFGTASTYGVEAILTAYPTKFWTLNGSVSLFQQTIDGSNVQAGVDNSLLAWYAKAVSTCSLWDDASFQVIGNYYAPTAVPQGFRIAQYNIDLAVQQKILEGKGRIRFVVTDIFNILSGGLVIGGERFTFSRIGKVDTRAILLTFAYTFGATFKEKLMENTFSND